MLIMFSSNTGQHNTVTWMKFRILQTLSSFISNDMQAIEVGTETGDFE
jgi:hypothetical protein